MTNIEYTTKEKITNFGKVWYFTDEENVSRFALYMYNDEPQNFYLSNIYVDVKYRQSGRGNYVLEKATEIAKKHNAENIMLKVLSNSFMHKWYKRNGFKDLIYDEEESEYIWMIKKINNNNLTNKNK